MAYITAEQVKNIRDLLKKEFSGIKFSVKKVDNAKVSIVIKSGNVDFFASYSVKKENVIGKYIIVSRYNYEKDFTGEAAAVLKRVDEIAHSQGYYDNSDSMIDYFDTAYYVDVKIGDWDAPYILSKKNLDREGKEEVRKAS